MLIINGLKCKILKNEIKYANATVNKLKGYSISINVEFELDSTKGYFSFFVDFFNNNNFTNIVNKIYIENPTDFNSKIDSFEMFDTKSFIDFIDSEVNLEFGNIINNQIETKLYINDEQLKLSYEGNLNINNIWFILYK